LIPIMSAPKSTQAFASSGVVIPQTLIWILSTVEGVMDFSGF